MNPGAGIQAEIRERYICKARAKERPECAFNHLF